MNKSEDRQGEASVVAVDATSIAAESPKNRNRKTIDSKIRKDSPQRPGSMSKRKTELKSPPSTPSSAGSPLRPGSTLQKRKTELQSPPPTPSSTRQTNNSSSISSTVKSSEASTRTNVVGTDPTGVTSTTAIIEESAVVTVSESAVEVYIPPSRRLRDITYVQVWKKQEDKLAQHAASYSLRRKKKETEEVNIARRLFTYLRLQPHTGKPCLGLTHFMRRIEYTKKHFTICQWYLDAMYENPINSNNEVYSILYNYNRTNIIARARYCLNNFEVKLTLLNNYHNNEKHISILISLMDVYESMMKKAPVLLGSFLSEVILNRFSYDSIKFIISNIDLQLTGDEKSPETVSFEFNNKYKRLWRADFRGEFPRLQYLKHGVTINDNTNTHVYNDDHLKFRGPVYAKHKFMSGIYFKISFYLNMEKDVMIKFSSPIDGNFSGHSYSKKIFYITLTRAEIIAYTSIMQLDTDSRDCTYTNITNTLDMLHLYNQELLYNFLLDSIELELKLVMNGHPETRSVDADVEKAVEGVMTTSNFYNPIYTRDKLMKLMLKYNLWSRRLLPSKKPRAVSLTKAHYDTVDDSIVKLDRAAHWSLHNPMSSVGENKGKLVEVYRDIWVTDDLERYFGVGDMRSLKKKQAFKMQSTTGIPGQELIQLSELPAFVPLETGGYLSVSYWKVRIFTNEAKSQFFLDLAPSDPSDKTVMEYLEQKETEFMLEEDNRSARYALQSNVQETRRMYVSKLSKLNKYLNTDLKKKFTEVSRRIQEKKRIVTSCKHSVLTRWEDFIKIRYSTNYVSTIVKINIATDPVEGDEKNIAITIDNNQEIDMSKLSPVDAETMRQITGQIKSVLTSMNTSKRVNSQEVHSTTTILNQIVTDLYSAYNRQEKVIIIHQSKLQTAPKKCEPSITKMIEARTVRNSTSSACHNRFTVNVDEKMMSMKNSYRQVLPWVRVPLDGTSKITPFTRRFESSNYIFGKATQGPFDLLSMVVYNPETACTWQVVTCLNPELCFPWSNGADLNGDKASVTNSITKIAANRIVSNALMHGYVSSMCHAMTEYFEEDNISVCKKLDKTISEIDEVTNILSELSNSDDPAKLKEIMRWNSVEYEEYVHDSNDSSYLDPSLQNEITARLVIDNYSVPPIEYRRRCSISYEYANQEAAEVPMEDLMSVHGLFIHFDQAKPCIQTVCSAFDWPVLTSNLLGNNYQNLKRIHTATGLLFYNNETNVDVNPRVSQWMDDYRFYTAGNLRQQCVKLKREQGIYNYKNGLPQVIHGNVFILLRYAELLPIALQWMKIKYKEYEPIRLMRKAREGREKQYRIDNHIKYRNKVLATASVFRIGFELLFTKNHIRDTTKGNVIMENGVRLEKNITWKMIGDILSAHEQEAGSINPYNDVSINAPFLDTYQRLIHYCRVLLSQFLLLRNSTDQYTSKQRNVDKVLKELSPDVLDEYNLVDSDLIHHDDARLLRFDSFPDDATFTNFIEIIKFDYSPKNESSIATKSKLIKKERHDLQPRAGQLIYCVYQLHCYECMLPYNMCTFPGCSTIRSYAVNKLVASAPVETNCDKGAGVSHVFSDHKLLANFNGEQLYSQDYMIGTGNHPIEIGIKLFLLYGKELLNYDLQMLYRDPVGTVPEMEIAHEKQLDDEDAKRRFDESELKIHWEKLLNDGREFRFIHRRLLNPAIHEALKFHQIIAINNIGNKDEKFVAYDSSYDPYAKLHAPLIISDDSSQITLQENDFVAPTSRLVSLPRTLAIEMLGGEKGEDSRGFKLSPIEIDPYPQESHASRVTIYINHKRNKKHMMSPLMFQWLTSHLSTARPCRQPFPASGDRGQHLTERVALKFDRMHCESSIILDDGSLVIIQIFHGIIEDSKLYLDEQEISGSADGAIRYIPVHEIEKLKSGLTLVAYDVKSDVACCLALQGKSLERISMAFILKSDDYPGIAKKIIEEGQHVIRISRIGSVCTGVSVDINAMIRSENKARPRHSNTSDVNIGRKCTINKSNHTERLKFAGLVCPRKSQL